MTQSVNLGMRISTNSRIIPTKHLNMPATAIQIPLVGCVYFFQSPRAKRLRITIKRDKTIRVTMPRRGNLNEAKEFLLSKISWIQKHLRKMDQYANLREIGDLNIDMEKAQTYLFNRLNYFCEKYNFSYSRAVFRCQKTRWGSCSVRNNINLNIKIAMLPEHLQDYVLLHELVHTKHKNHGRKFWAEMDRLVGDARKLRKEIRSVAL
jgi:predicted metal-dependent hydrolase